MRVLFLGDPANRLVSWIRQSGDEVLATDAPLRVEEVREKSPDIIVSYGYRHILSETSLAVPRRGAVNLHISYLPWNQGADPNFWSHVEGTPKGVTLHWMDAGVDTGDIIAQQAVSFAPDDTLRSSYEKLQKEIQALFQKHWPAIRAGTAPRKPQQGPGTSHRKRDMLPHQGALSKGWDTPLSALPRLPRRTAG